MLQFWILLWTIRHWILCYHKWDFKIKRIWSFCELLFSFKVDCSETSFLSPSRSNQQTQITYLVIDISWNSFYLIILQTRTVSFYRNKYDSTANTHTCWITTLFKEIISGFFFFIYLLRLLDTLFCCFSTKRKELL